MPLFFFHLRTPAGLERDEMGIAYPSLEAAYLAAFDTIPAVSAEMLRDGGDPMACAFVIADADGRELMDVPFAEKVRRRSHQPPPRAASPLASVIAKCEKAQTLLAAVREQHDALLATVAQTRAILATGQPADGARDPAA